MATKKKPDAAEASAAAAPVEQAALDQVTVDQVVAEQAADESLTFAAGDGVDQASPEASDAATIPDETAPPAEDLPANEAADQADESEGDEPTPAVCPVEGPPPIDVAGVAATLAADLGIPPEVARERLDHLAAAIARRYSIDAVECMRMLCDAPSAPLAVLCAQGHDEQARVVSALGVRLPLRSLAPS